MKAISTWQPWASLLVLGLKCFETRDYPLPHTLKGVRVAIHAAKKRVTLVGPVDEAVRIFLSHYGLTPEDLPHGAVVGAVDFKASYRMGTQIPGRGRTELWTVADLVKQFLPKHYTVAGEAALGDFRPGRWAWQVDSPVQLPRPIPYKGAQGVFHLSQDASADVWQQLAERQGIQSTPTREITRPILIEGTKAS